MSELLNEVLDAHGGLHRWRSARRIHARARTGGLLPGTRFPGNRLSDYRVTVDVGQPRTVLDPFPRDGLRGVFDNGAVHIETTDGSVLQSRSDPRAAFFGASGVRRNFRWDALDSVYFAGYAMWNYLTMPYLLVHDGVTVADGGDWDEGTETWRRLHAGFPPGLDTHSAGQTFYFDAAGLLRRHDYVAEVVGGWAKAAHRCADHVRSDGLVFPTRRWVRPIGPGNRILPFPTLVSIQLAEVRVDAG